MASSRATWASSWWATTFTGPLVVSMCTSASRSRRCSGPCSIRTDWVLACGTMSRWWVIQPCSHDLSEREIDVLRMLARGRSNVEIAGDLFISEATVKTHLTRILSKMGARDRLQAVIAAYEMGFVEPGGAAE